MKSIGPVCIVDDDESIRESLDGFFRSLGLAVRSYPSAEAYLGRGAEEPPGCLIVDVAMPGMSGLDLQEELLRLGDGTPIVFVSAAASDTMRRRALDRGAISFLSKPFDEERLLAAVEEAMKRRAEGESP